MPKADESWPIKPDMALVEHLSRVETSDEPVPTSSANCLVFWARPPSSILKLIESVQLRLHSLVGKDLHLIPLPHVHLSVLELSHRHSISHLRNVYNAVGGELLQKMLDISLLADVHSGERASAPWLVKPQLMVDSTGVAVTFVPDCDDAPKNNKEEEGSNMPETTTNPFTYHHLRASMQTLALTSGVEIDTCYTAATAHITIARFISSNFFDMGDEDDRAPNGLQPMSFPSHDTIGGHVKTERVAQWIELVEKINFELREQFETPEAKGMLEWVVGQEAGLEVQLGYVKYGREAKRAEMVGRSITD